MATNGKSTVGTNGAKKTPTVRLEKRATAEETIKKVGGGSVYLRKLKKIREDAKSTKTNSKTKVNA